MITPEMCSFYVGMLKYGCYIKEMHPKSIKQWINKFNGKIFCLYGRDGAIISHYMVEY